MVTCTLSKSSALSITCWLYGVVGAQGCKECFQLGQWWHRAQKSYTAKALGLVYYRVYEQCVLLFGISSLHYGVYAASLDLAPLLQVFSFSSSSMSFSSAAVSSSMTSSTPSSIASSAMSSLMSSVYLSLDCTSASNLSNACSTEVGT